MFRNITKKKVLIYSGILLIALNGLAVYLINNSIEQKLALAGINDHQKIASVEQYAFLSTVFAAFIITFDIVGVLFLLYLLHKFIFKTLKKATTIKP